MTRLKRATDEALEITGAVLMVLMGLLMGYLWLHLLDWLLQVRR